MQQVVPQRLRRERLPGEQICGKLLQESAIRALVQNIASCDEVWVVSRGAGENLRSLGYEGDYIVMENGVDVPRGRVSDEAIAAATGRYDLPQNVPVFLFVGRLMWYKGIRIILDALKTLREKNVDFRMVFVGEGADGAEIRSYAEEQKLSDRCFFTGAISDREIIRAWYGRSDLFLFPSTFDTNGLVVREAAASGTATVMIRNSCASEGVGDGRNGFCIEENAAAMAAKLEELCRAPKVMQVVGENAQRELYVSWETAAQPPSTQLSASMYDIRQNLLSSWLPPGGSCQTALRNRLTDEGRRTVGQRMQLDERYMFQIVPFNREIQNF